MPLSPEGFANSLLTNYSARNKKSPKTHISLVFMLFFQLYSTNIIEHLRVNVSSLQEKFSRMKTPSISLWFSDFYIQNLLFSSFFPCHSLLFIPIFSLKNSYFPINRSPILAWEACSWPILKISTIGYSSFWTWSW